MDDRDGHQNNLQRCILNFCSSHPGLSCPLKSTGIQKPVWALWSASHWNSWPGPQSRAVAGTEGQSGLGFACTSLPRYKELDHLRELDLSGPPIFCLVNFPVCSRKPEWCLLTYNSPAFCSDWDKGDIPPDKRQSDYMKFCINTKWKHQNERTGILKKQNMKFEVKKKH